jgi:hypothetical protein
LPFVFRNKILVERWVFVDDFLFVDFSLWRGSDACFVAEVVQNCEQDFYGHGGGDQGHEGHCEVKAYKIIRAEMDQKSGDDNVPEHKFSDMNRFDDFPAVEDLVVLTV